MDVMSNEIDLYSEQIKDWRYLIPSDLPILTKGHLVNITEWCRENLEGRWAHYDHHMFVIESDQDVVMFKLKWSSIDGNRAEQLRTNE